MTQKDILERAATCRRLLEPRLNWGAIHHVHHVDVAADDEADLAANLFVFGKFYYAEVFEGAWRGQGVYRLTAVFDKTVKVTVSKE